MKIHSTILSLIYVHRDTQDNCHTHSAETRTRLTRSPLFINIQFTKIQVPVWHSHILIILLSVWRPEHENVLGKVQCIWLVSLCFCYNAAKGSRFSTDMRQPWHSYSATGVTNSLKKKPPTEVPLRSHIPNTLTWHWTQKTQEVRCPLAIALQLKNVVWRDIVSNILVWGSPSLHRFHVVPHFSLVFEVI